MAKNIIKQIDEECAGVTDLLLSQAQFLSRQAIEHGTIDSMEVFADQCHELAVLLLQASSRLRQLDNKYMGST